MNLFEDLLEDLKKENLLDEGTNEAFVSGDNLIIPPDLPIVKTTSNSVFREVSTFYDNSSLKLSEKSSTNSFQIQPAVPNDNENSFPVNYNPVLLLSPVQPRKLRKVQLKNKKKGRYCKTCLILVPYYRFRCRFCDEIVTEGFIYSLLIFFSIIVLFAVILVLIANKTYK